jgi:Replication protein
MSDNPKDPGILGDGRRASAPQARGDDRALDNMGSRVSYDGSQWAEKKYQRVILRKTAAKIFPEEAVARCGQYTGRGGLELRGQPASALMLGPNGAYYTNMVTCKSVWLCAVCAAKVSEERRLIVESVVNGVQNDGGTVLMFTLTQGHKGFALPKPMRKDLSKRWQKMLGGQAWKQIQADCHILGTCRALEVTYGKNGWHPHLHVLVFLSRDASTESTCKFVPWLMDRWIRYTEADGNDCERGAQHVRIADSSVNAGDYMSKFGVDWEMTHAHLKRGRTGRAPFQILADFSEVGWVPDAELFRQYGLAFKGARQLTWSGKARKMYSPQVADLKRLYKNNPETKTICIINEETMRQIKAARMYASGRDRWQSG